MHTVAFALPSVVFSLVAFVCLAVVTAGSILLAEAHLREAA